MPLTLNVGISKKIGQPDFGSLGASCNVTVELDQGLLRSDLDAFHQHVRNAFAACREAVHGELALHGRSDPNAAAGGNGHHDRAQQPQGAGQTGNGQPRTVGRSATHSQVRAIRAIAGKHRVDLARILQERFCVGRPEDLSVPEASGLIDELKEAAQQTQAAR